MEIITMRELRNNGAEVLDRVAGGEELLVTRGGVPSATITKAPPTPTSTKYLVAEFRKLPPVDHRKFQADIDRVIDQRW